MKKILIMMMITVLILGSVPTTVAYAADKNTASIQTVITPAWNPYYKTYSDGIKKSGVSLGRFYIKCAFEDPSDPSTYLGWVSYWCTKAADVELLEITDCVIEELPLGNGIVALVSYEMIRNGVYSVFYETDYFYF